jgi:protein gp37
MRWGGTTHWGAGVARYRTSASNWKQPLLWNKKAAASGKVHRVFCASLADVFDNEAPQEWRQDLWHLIGQTPHLFWLLVTKRVGNVRSMVPGVWLDQFPSNVRLLITVCNQEEADRDIPKLLALPCMNGASYEPALDVVDFKLDHLKRHAIDGNGVRRLDWLIVGGESAQGGALARPFDLAWARSTVAQCKAAGVSVFVKQLGSNHWKLGDPLHGIRDRAGAEPAEWPEDLRVREFPR